MTPEPCSAHQYLHATWSTFFLIHSTPFLSTLSLRSPKTRCNYNIYFRLLIVQNSSDLYLFNFRTNKYNNRDTEAGWTRKGVAPTVGLWNGFFSSNIDPVLLTHHVHCTENLVYSTGHPCKWKFGQTIPLPIFDIMIFEEQSFPGDVGHILPNWLYKTEEAGKYASIGS